jgi:hypothetical protein
MNRYLKVKDGRCVPMGLIMVDQIDRARNDLDTLKKLLCISLVEFKESEDLLEYIVYILVDKLIRVNFGKAMKIFMETVFPLRALPVISKLITRSIFMFMHKNFDNYKHTAIKKKWMMTMIKSCPSLPVDKWYEVIAYSKKFKKSICLKWSLPITRIVSQPAYDNIIKSNFKNGNYSITDWCNVFIPYAQISPSTQIIKILSKYSPRHLSLEMCRNIFTTNRELSPKKMYIISELILSKYEINANNCFDISDKLNKFKLALFAIHQRKNSYHWIEFNKHYHIIITIYQMFITKNLTRLALYFYYHLDFFFRINTEMIVLQDASGAASGVASGVASVANFSKLA